MAAARPSFCHAHNDTVWLLVWLLLGRESLLANHQNGLYLGKYGGRNWVRTSDPSLVRRVLYH
jgi:hypothetical protein